MIINASDKGDMMNIFKKLQVARIMLQNTELKKSGLNKFAGYKYFELGDFLPTVQKIFSEVGLCGIVSYTADLATLAIIDTDIADSSLRITSPMGSAALKGCHEVQNIGAVETYQRRYLWVTAMEIVEHDVLDAGTKEDKPEKLASFKTIIQNDLDDHPEDAVKLQGVADKLAVLFNNEDYEAAIVLIKDNTDGGDPTLVNVLAALGDPVQWKKLKAYRLAVKARDTKLAQAVAVAKMNQTN